MIRRTHKELERYKRILGECETVVIAAKRLGVTPTAISCAFRQAGDTASKYLLQRPARVTLPPDPVAKHEEKTRVAKAEASIKELVEQLKQSEARNRIWDAISRSKEVPKIVRVEKTSGLRDVCAVALATDHHIEEPVLPESVGNRNEYNLQIADRRLERYFQAIIWNIQHHRASKRLSIRHLLLWMGGDLFTGYIHPEMIENNVLSPTEAVRWLLPRFEGGIRTLLKILDLEQISVVCSYGNHGRTTEKMRVATSASNSFDLLLYLGLEDRLKDEAKRVSFQVDKSDHQYAQVYEWTLHFHHGHDVRYMGGVGGIGIPLLKKVAAWDRVRKAEWHFIGHHHTLRDFGRAVVNGSLIGYSPYSMHIGADFEKPAQYFCLIDSKEGKCMPSALWVQDSKERYK